MVSPTLRLLMIPLFIAILANFLLFLWAPSATPREDETRWTARFMFGFWAVALSSRIIQGRSPQTRAWWTVACGLFIVHVLVAFGQVHGWSHAHAFDHVEQTSGYGPGIFVSYFFTLVWLLDVLVWWRWPKTIERRAAVWEWLLHGFMAFIMFNGTVVYETGPIRYVGIAVFIGLVVLIYIAGINHM